MGTIAVENLPRRRHQLLIRPAAPDDDVGKGVLERLSRLAERLHVVVARRSRPVLTVRSYRPSQDLRHGLASIRPSLLFRSRKTANAEHTRSRKRHRYACHAPPRPR